MSEADIIKRAMRAHLNHGRPLPEWLAAELDRRAAAEGS